MTVRSAALNRSTTWASSEPLGKTTDSTRVGLSKETRSGRRGRRSAGWASSATGRLLMAFATTHFAQQQRRLDRGHRCLLSFVLARSRDSAPVESLLLAVAREHAEPYRDAGVERDAGESVCDGTAHVFEVWRAPTDDN